MNLSASSIEELRVPVRRAEVGFHTEREERTAVLFLAPGASPEDLFEDDAPFFPAEDDGVVRFFARAAVVAVVVDETVSESRSAFGIPYDRRAISVHLRNGKVISGGVLSVGRTRTLDLLNQPAKSFAVHAEGKVHHIAKAHVEHIEEGR